jgi:glycosyltransferase involved in cell wall biosynthesis
MMNNASAVVAQSNNTRSNAERYYSPDRTIQIIPLGFEQPSFTMVARETLGMEKNTFYLISIGRLIKRKGYEYLIAALKDTDRDSKLLLIGDGPLEHDLKGLARELDVQSRVLFLGAVSEEKKFQYLSCADSYVLSSLHEGYGIVLQEAMFCGLPIISTDNGGQTDFLSEGVNALLVPIEDSKALSRAIQKLKHDVSMREGMRHNNKLAIENVSIEKIAAAYEALFEKAAV